MTFSMSIKIFKNKMQKWDFYLRKSFLTYWTRPKQARDIDIIDEHRNSKRIAIVVQGKLEEKDDFTLESVRLYRKLYPTVDIIVSTWKGVQEKQVELLKESGAVVLLNEIPNPLTGFCNNNLQRISSLNGILKAKELGAEYVLKCRTDQRFYEGDIFSFMIKLQKQFPLKLKCKAEERVVICSVGTFNTRLYNWTDMFTFGTISDVLRYYSCPEDSRDHNAPFVAKDLMDYCMQRPGEIYFATHYIESLGFELKWNYEDSDYYLRELAIVIDNEMIDLFWPKYTKREYIWRRYENIDLKQVTFKKWLCMQND